ncbi:FFLEELY motif protein [Marinobacter alexandrii]|uniref:FFLEELY motif protein n=1 Tax=Marinobacter alexandrii TaxID=2570351 RepID=UPI0011093CF2|nr:hypothetical protein [Marinobacter alexandrii]
MYRKRLVATEVTTDNGRLLRHLLLAYHDFRQHKAAHPLLADTVEVADWQAQRLKTTHQDLYEHPGYHTGLEFLLSDLYAPSAMTGRDDNIDRVFPKMVKWLPDHLLGTLARLVELNLITQQLDLELAEQLREAQIPADSLTVAQYCEAFRQSRQLPLRGRQLELIEDVGLQLDRYVRNRTLGWLLSMTKAPADMAGLADLHGFMHRGFMAFRAMDDVDSLIERLVSREQRVMDNILAGHSEPFRLPADL